MLHVLDAWPVLAECGWKQCNINLTVFAGLITTGLQPAGNVASDMAITAVTLAGTARAAL